MDEQLLKIRDQFVAELLPLRPHLGASWDALQTALKPTLNALGRPVSTIIVECAPVSSPWKTAIASFDAQTASEVSRVLISLSDALTAWYRKQNPPKEVIGHVIGVYFIDVQRPLWQAYPELQPFEDG